MSEVSAMCVKSFTGGVCGILLEAGKQETWTILPVLLEITMPFYRHCSRLYIIVLDSVSVLLLVFLSRLLAFLLVFHVVSSLLQFKQLRGCLEWRLFQGLICQIVIEGMQQGRSSTEQICVIDIGSSVAQPCLPETSEQPISSIMTPYWP